MAPTVFLTTVLALLIGPILAYFARQLVALRGYVNRISIIAVVGLTFLLIVPGAVSEGGMVAVVFMAAGFLVPMLLHRLGGGRAHLGADGILIFGVIVHVAVESAALGIATNADLGLAITAHRVPVGLAVFLLAPNNRVAWIAIVLLIVAAILGFLGGQSVLQFLTDTQYVWLEGFVAGSLLHVAHSHHHHRRGPHTHVSSDVTPE